MILQKEQIDLKNSNKAANKIPFEPSKEQLGERTSISASQEATRAKIAWTFTQIFLLIVVLVIIMPTVIKIAFPYVISDAIESTKTLLTLVASVLAGPFGFIVGFYFKQEKENN